MFRKIAVPIDLAHLETLHKALAVAIDMAKRHDALICYVGVATSAPGSVAHTPEEFARKLQDFAAAQAAEHGVLASSEALISHDPAVDLERTLENGIARLGADLVVMATHQPGMADYIWSGHGAHVAAHSKASVLLVRD